MKKGWFILLTGDTPLLVHITAEFLIATNAGYI
jgi:hypothetical protein